MATGETNIVHTIILDAQKFGVTCFKNVRGFFWTLDVVEKCVQAVREGGLKGLLDLVKSGRLRKVMAGLLFPGASDLVGWTSETITPEMVGQKIARFTVFEVKTATGKPSKEQEKFIDIVQKAGGYAGVARSAEDAKRIVRKGL